MLVTDRGRVVAEIRQPSVGGVAPGVADDRPRALIAAGVLSVGLPNSPDAYRTADIHLPAQVVAQALDETRGDR